MLSAESVKQFAAQVEQALGPVSILVNNAGEQPGFDLCRHQRQRLRTEELHLKFFSVIYPTRAFLPQLEKQPGAAIVCVNSLLAAQPEPHMVATGGPRGIKQPARSMATEFAPKRASGSTVSWLA